MKFKLSTESLARGSARHPWITIAIWVLALVLSVFITATYLGDALTMEDRATNNPESQRASELVKKGFKDFDKKTETVVIDSSVKVSDPAYGKFVDDLGKEITKLGDDVVEGSVTYFQTGAPSMVSKDKYTTIIPLTLAGDSKIAGENIEEVREVIRAADKADNRFNVMIVGGTSLNKDFQEVSKNDLKTGEMYGILVAIVILTLVFGTLVSAVIPIILAVVAIIAAIGATALVGQSFELSFFVVNMITMMGLAVGIDYSLFIVSRYREELAKGYRVIDAITRAGATASRAVFFSGMMVLLALVGMLLVPHTVFRSLGAGAILVVMFAILASLTLLPAVLRLMGTRVNSLRLPWVGRKAARTADHAKRGFWHTAAKSVMRHPIISLVFTLTVLVTLVVPYFSIDLGSAIGPDTLPDSFETKKAYQILDDKFSVGNIAPTLIVIDGKVESADVQKGIKRLKSSLESNDLFGPANLQVNEDGDLGVVNAPIKAPAQSDQAYRAIDLLREKYIPQAFAGVDVEVLVTGNTAGQLDFTKITEDYLPIVFAFVLGFSFLLLTVVFRSIIVPIKAIIMNLLSVGAAYGLLVLVFQKGIGAELLGFSQVDVIEAWIPLMLFSILFGLSMDYHVFLLTRIREHFDETGDNTESVAFGLSSTGSIITGAAVIMVAVFGGFASGDLIMFQQMGFGLAAAVLLDATIVRSILVPASMRLLGKRNWYLPKVLSWLPDLNVEGTKKEEQPAKDAPQAA